jgi:hypothetical protein
LKKGFTASFQGILHLQHGQQQLVRLGSFAHASNLTSNHLMSINHGSMAEAEGSLGRRNRPAAFEQNHPELELLSDRAPPKLHEPDNFSTFVSSPHAALPFTSERMASI